MMQTEQASAAWTLPEGLRQLALGGDADVVADIIAVFKTDTAERLQMLREALEQLDAKKLKEQAHAIKGSAAQVGADSLAALCQRIELEARHDPPPDLEALVEQAEASFERLCSVDAV